jgi:uncharacterized membrane protein YeaQ/YmgE (transglycosylase-associated protein family)
MLLAFAPIAGHHIIAWLAIGLLAGLLAGVVMRGGGFGLVGDIVTGLLGALIGGLIYHAMTGAHASPSFGVEVVISFAGAVLLLFVERVLSRGRGARHGRFHL